MEGSNDDEFVKSRSSIEFVIPAKAGIQSFQRLINILSARGGQNVLK